MSLQLMDDEERVRPTVDNVAGVCAGEDEDEEEMPELK